MPLLPFYGHFIDFPWRARHVRNLESLENVVMAQVINSTTGQEEDAFKVYVWLFDSHTKNKIKLYYKNRRLVNPERRKASTAVLCVGLSW